jgi:triosephosphate isomerase (TIM)
MLLLVGNWKMAPGKLSDAQKLAKNTLSLARRYSKKLTIVAAIPFVYLSPIKKSLRALKIASQSVAATTEIAQTGCISALQLRDIGIQYGIVGHSEARARGETNEEVANQTLRLIEQKITPIVCVGEKSRDQHGWYLSEIKDQVESVLSRISKGNLKKICIAYEPVWAIGAKAEREATPAECREMVVYIRKVVADLFDTKAGDMVQVIYGGSVDEKNANLFITEGKAQGLLVGRVSLDPKKFSILAQSIIL